MHVILVHMKKRGDVPESDQPKHRERRPELTEYRSERLNEPRDVREEADESRESDIRRTEEIRASLVDDPSAKTHVAFHERFGDFSPDDVGADERIRLTKENARYADTALATFRASARSSLATGIRIAAEYDIRVNNFSTNTKIIALPDGKKAFAVFAHPGSTIHRFFDGINKHAAGLRMAKVSRGAWKRAFEEHARIPLIACSDPHTVLMPYIPNVNAHDVIANNYDIPDFGKMTWANTVDVNAKHVLLANVMQEIDDIHRGGIAWGECILPNLIFTEQQRAIMCDPEIRFDDDVPLPDAQARDLLDIVLSSCAAMRKSEGTRTYNETVKLLLDNYSNDNVIAILQGQCDVPFTITQHLSFWNEKLRTGIESKKEYDAVVTAIRTYRR